MDGNEQCRCAPVGGDGGRCAERLSVVAVVVMKYGESVLSGDRLYLLSENPLDLSVAVDFGLVADSQLLGLTRLATSMMVTTGYTQYRDCSLNTLDRSDDVGADETERERELREGVQERQTITVRKTDVQVEMAGV